MITTLEQCKEVQARRVKSGKRGYSKAVRRFVAANFDDYRGTLKQLPVSWEVKPAPEEDPKEQGNKVVIDKALLN